MLLEPCLASLLVPACAEWPGVIEPGAVVDARCSTVDYFPTIAALTGFSFKSKEARPIDGIDLMPLIRGEQDERGQDLFFGYRRLFDGTDGAAVISGDYKLLREAKKDGRMRLYNLAADPFETKDLTSDMPEVAAALSKRLKELDASCQLSRDGADYKY